ncbi:MAG: hypothetical protein Q4P07_02075 [Ornithinimicrobium sp.]|uniref:hypothetical protein n=1 Tax=Ornithinimicrobium sp. TaxID=1977084 RepID=UPI0026E04A05|nr:hypothetical protein [Ornithinimicrobium sp.]MDO5738917.1 hypothetical protein [Ornithinimicrobium sp.]
MSRIGIYVLTPALVLVLGRCSAEPSGEAAAQAVARFVQAVANDPATACALLAPETRKELEDSEETSREQGLAEQRLPTGSGES